MRENNFRSSFAARSGVDGNLFAIKMSDFPAPFFHE